MSKSGYINSYNLLNNKLMLVVREKLFERQYSESIINEWLDYI